ncbi:MAG: pyridoxal phosphate-dependent aminotransferase, partial [Lachnospirales bacterium]
MKNNNLHGGDLDEISRIYNINKEDIINFSGNVNPLGLPKSVKEAIINKVDNITNYPDTEYLSLRKAIGNYTKCDFENIIVGNGSTELISGFIKFVKPKSAVVISPAYSEYLKEIKAQGADCVLYELKENEDFVLNIKGLFNVINENTDLLVICNPNNPTGSYITEDNLRVILNYCKKFNVKVMIDETYVEFSDRHIKVSAIGLIKDFDNLFIVRGTSKFFACPGVRLGYGICKNKETI